MIIQYESTNSTKTITVIILIMTEVYILLKNNNKNNKNNKVILPFLKKPNLLIRCPIF